MAALPKVLLQIILDYLSWDLALNFDLNITSARSEIATVRSVEVSRTCLVIVGENFDNQKLVIFYPLILGISSPSIIHQTSAPISRVLLAVHAGRKLPGPLSETGVFFAKKSKPYEHSIWNFDASQEKRMLSKARGIPARLLWIVPSFDCFGNRVNVLDWREEHPMLEPVYKSTLFQTYFSLFEIELLFLILILSILLSFALIGSSGLGLITTLIGSVVALGAALTLLLRWFKLMQTGTRVASKIPVKRKRGATICLSDFKRHLDDLDLLAITNPDPIDNPGENGSILPHYLDSDYDFSTEFGDASARALVQCSLMQDTLVVLKQNGAACQIRVHNKAFTKDHIQFLDTAINK